MDFVTIKEGNSCGGRTVWEGAEGAVQAKEAGGPRWKDVISSMSLTEAFIRNGSNVSHLIIVMTEC